MAPQRTGFTRAARSSHNPAQATTAAGFGLSPRALNRSITAPGGKLRPIADFGSEQLKIAQAAVSQEVDSSG